MSGWVLLVALFVSCSCAVMFELLLCRVGFVCAVVGLNWLLVWLTLVGCFLGLLLCLVCYVYLGCIFDGVCRLFDLVE